MASDMMLYWGSGSVPSWRAMLALEEKGLQGYNQKMIVFSKKEHKGEEVLKINPRGEVPTFKHGDIVVNESTAICEYLESVFSTQGTKLIPDDAAGKAKVFQRMHEAPNLNKVGIEQIVYYLMRTKKEERNEDLIKEKIEALRKELDIWNGYLSQQAGQDGYLCGKFSMADCIFFPILATTVRFGLKLADGWPHVQSYYTLMCERPSVKATWPPHWNTSEGNGMLSDV